jgi:branched-chain amino acid transport system substrate-binding protein
MILRRFLAGSAAAALLALPLVGSPAAAQQEEAQYFPGLPYRSGPYAPSGIPLGSGYADYLAMLQARDGGINGVPIHYEECDTGYNNDRGVECYERLKDSGPTEPAAWHPLSTGITYALIPRVTQDEAPMLSIGYGRADAADGRVFPWIFNPPITYWAGADAIIQYIQAEEGGNLEGKKIALVYHDSAYGREPIATLERLAEEEGYELSLFPVAPPGLEQKATWLQVARQLRPDWTLMWGWGVMNSTAIQEAAAVGYPMDRFIGIWWSGTEPDARPAGQAGAGYKSLNFHATGTDFPAIQDILTHVYDQGNGSTERDTVGEVNYNRGVLNAAVTVEAVRAAQAEFGERPLTGEEVRWGLENLEISLERWKELGLDGFAGAISLSCEDHEGGGSAYVQQWNGSAWEPVSDWIQPRNDELRPAYEASAEQYAEEQGLELRDCSAM